jgi:hypothetical protein
LERSKLQNKSVDRLTSDIYTHALPLYFTSSVIKHAHRNADSNPDEAFKNISDFAASDK